MNKLLAAQIDADVSGPAARCVEEYEIAGMQSRLRDGVAFLADLRRLPRQQHARRLAINVAHETTAIESLLGIVATPSIRDTDHRPGLRDYAVKICCACDLACLVLRPGC